MMLTNIGLFSLQAGVIILAGMLAVRLLRVARPLVYLQLLLLAVLLLPVVQTWQRPVITVAQVLPGRVVLPVTALERVNAPVAVDWAFGGWRCWDSACWRG